MKIKICGLRRKEDIEYVNEIQPDYIGFIFYKKSKRYVTMEIAKDLKAKLSKNIKAVGVFVNEDIDVIKQICGRNIIDVIQLHGDEDKVYINELRKVINLPIIKGIRVQNIIQVEEANEFPVDYLLFDAYKKKQYGGTGEKFDWKLIEGVGKPFFLAGGIGIEDISEAKKIDTYCIDVSSSVETNGVKDIEKIRKIVREVMDLKVKSIPRPM